jgi:hypothetical protein
MPSPLVTLLQNSVPIHLTNWEFNSQLRYLLHLRVVPPPLILIRRIKMTDQIPTSIIMLRVRGNAQKTVQEKETGPSCLKGRHDCAPYSTVGMRSKVGFLLEGTSKF